MAVTYDIAKMLRGWDYDSLQSIFKNNRLEELVTLMEEMQEFEESYRKRYMELKTHIAADNWNTIEKELFGGYSKNSLGFMAQDKSDKLTRSKYLNLSNLVNNKDISAISLNRLKSDYKNFISKAAELTEALTQLGLDIRGVDTFETIITTRSMNESLTGLFKLNLDEMKEIYKDLNLVQIRINESGKAVFGARERISDQDFIDGILKIFSNNLGEQEQINEASQYNAMFQELRQLGILSTSDKNIPTSRIAELMNNPLIMDQLIQVNGNGEQSIDTNLLAKLRYYMDTESFITGNDIMLPTLGYEASSKSLRSGGYGFQIAEIGTLVNAVQFFQQLLANEDSYNNIMSQYSTGIDKPGNITTIDGVPLTDSLITDQAVDELQPIIDSWQ